MKRKLFAAVTILMLLLIFQGCSKNNRHPVPDMPDIIDRETFDNVGTSTEQEDVGFGWKDNYMLKYNYIYEGETSSIIEVKSGEHFSIIDEETGLTVYYTQGENGAIDYYTLSPENKTGTYLSRPDSLIADLYSPFMNLSFVSPDFTGFENVEYEADEDVNGRSAKRYRQSAVDEEGELTDYLIVWIDDEYGFASKCTICKADSTVEKAWELIEFQVGAIDAESAKIDLDEYEIKETQE